MTREEAIYWIENLSGGGEGQYREAQDMAISALREQEDRSKGCPCCNLSATHLSEKQIKQGVVRSGFFQDGGYYGSYYIVRYRDGSHSILTDDGWAETVIKFCPMCGRRLEEVCPEE